MRDARRVPIGLYVYDTDKAALVKLASIWDTSQTETLRRLILEALTRTEKV